MNSKLTIAALSLLALPLAAQKTGYNMQLDMSFSGQSLSGFLVGNKGYDQDKNAFGLVAANVTGNTLQIPGLPLLIDPQVILAAGPTFGGLKWSVPFKAIPYDVHVQGGALVFGLIEASPIRMVKAAKSEPQPAPDKVEVL